MYELIVIKEIFFRKFICWHYSVTRFLTSNGVVYLKQTPPALSIELKITEILYEKFHAPVPEIIDKNKDLSCFLMKDAGIPLREIQKSNFQPDLLTKTLQKYTNLQVAVQNNINSFLELGMPDWRLEKLPLLYQRMVNKEALLKREGLTTDELKALHKLHPIITAMCELLSNYQIPETLNHCDFHDNNVLIESDTNNLTIIDWGEVVISHPFFSLISFVSTSAYRYSITETDKIFIEWEDVCLENWLNLGVKSSLLGAFRLAKKLWPIYSALGYYRLMISSHSSSLVDELNEWFSIGRNKGRLAGYFRVFMNTSEGLAPDDISRINLADPARAIRG